MERKQKRPYQYEKASNLLRLMRRKSLLDKRYNVFKNQNKDDSDSDSELSGDENSPPNDQQDQFKVDLMTVGKSRQSELVRKKKEICTECGRFRATSSKFTKQLRNPE